MEYGKTRNGCLCNNASNNNIKFKKDYAEKKSELTGIDIQTQHWGGNRQLSMEGIAVEYFSTSVNIGNKEEKYELHSYISDDNEQDECDLHAHMFHLFF